MSSYRRQSSFLTGASSQLLAAVQWTQGRGARLRNSVSASTVAPALLFLFTAIPTCLFFAQFNPLNEVPDEATHAVRAYSLLHGEIWGQRVDLPREDGSFGPVASLLVDTGFYRTVNGSVLAAETITENGHPSVRHRVDYGLIQEKRHAHWSREDVFEGVQNTAVYPPLFYVPAALGIGISRALHHSPYTAYLTARLVNAFCFLAIGTVSLLLAPRRRMFLFAALTIPMSLFLAGSCSQDGLLIAGAVLSVSLLMTAERWTDKRFLLSAAIVAALIAVRPIYFPLAAVFAVRFPFHRTTGSSWRHALRPFALMSAIILPGLIWALLAQHYVATPFVLSAYHPGPLWPGSPNVIFRAKDAAAQASVFLHHPTLLVRLPLHTMRGEGVMIWKETVGVFGWLSLILPSQTYSYWTWSLVLLCIGSSFGDREEPSLPAALPYAVLAALVGCVFVLYDVEYLTWTPVGMTEIAGMQGRYLLILVPFLTISIPRVRVRHGSVIRRTLSLPLILTSVWGIVALPEVLIKSYYL